MKIYCRKEMLYPVIRFIDDPLNWGFEYRDVKSWVEIPDSQDTRKVLVRYKLAAKEFREALEALNGVLNAGRKGRD